MKATAIKEVEKIPDAAFKAVIFYDDVGCAARAASSLERAADGADEAVAWDVKSWRLEALWQPALSVATLVAAADANLLLFALRDTHPPLEELLNWLEHWAANRRIEDSAVTLLGPEADADDLLRNELARFTRRHGLVFLDPREPWADQVSTPGVPPQPHRDLPGARELLPPADLEPAPSHWGIND